MFKIGDRVVVVKITEDYEEIGRTLGKVFTINYIHPKVTFPYAEAGEDRFSYCEEELVLEEIYNSPLYQALKEDS